MYHNGFNKSNYLPLNVYDANDQTFPGIPLTNNANVFTKSLSEVITILDEITKASNKTFSENVTNTDYLDRLKVVLKEFLESITNTDSLQRLISKVFNESQSYADSLIKNILKQFTENQIHTDTLDNIKIILKIFSETVSYADSLIKRISKTFSENGFVNDFLTKIYTPISGGIETVQQFILNLIFKKNTKINNEAKKFNLRNKK